MSLRETPERGPFLSLLMALLQGTVLRGFLSPRVPLMLIPRLMCEGSGFVRGLGPFKAREFRVSVRGLGV